MRSSRARTTSIGSTRALLPGILKSARLGYDGKGQARVATVAEARAAWHAMGAVPCVLEQKLALKLELSVVVARRRDGAVTTFPVAENEHRGGILAVSDRAGPHRRGAGAAGARRRDRGGAEPWTTSACCASNSSCSHDGRLLANEIAPRPHNSGHYTIDACISSQFDEQARVLAGQPLGDASLLAPAVMLNVLGDVWFGAISTASRTGLACSRYRVPSCICTARAKRGAAERWGM